jgi:hypothetical protein
MAACDVFMTLECHVVRFTLARLYIDSNLCDTLGCRSTFIMLYLVHEMEVNYLVVNEMFNISKID